MKDPHRSYHEGEMAVQSRAGVGKDGLCADEMYRPTMGAGVARFLAAQHICVLSTMDGEGRVWASMRSGQAGFIRAADETTVEIGGYGHRDDPLLTNLITRSAAGMLVIHLAARHRVRLNGDATANGDGQIRLQVNQVYGNCPQYIQAREVQGLRQPVSSPGRKAEKLDERTRKWVETADTFFLATAHLQSGMDASHRGGRPGFVRVENESRLLFPDYPGNRMFNSLGNISAYPNAGLLFVDFQSAAGLQLSGTASILWDNPQMTDFPGAQRMVALDIERILELPQATLLQFEFRNYSPNLRMMPVT